MEYSCFTSYGQLEYSSDLPDAEKIYESMRASYIDPKTGVPAVDLTAGTYHEAKIYAHAMAIADANASTRRAGNQGDPLKATESIPLFEKNLRLSPKPTATIEQRRAAVALRRVRSRGPRWEAISDAMAHILGAALIAIRPIAVHEATKWPADPSVGPGVFTRPEQPAKVVRLVDPVATLGSQVVAYENWDTRLAPLVLGKGDVLCIQPENRGLAEKVIVASVSGSGATRALTATFTKAHDVGASASTGPVPIWASNLGHLFIVVTAVAALSAELVDQVNERMTRLVKGGTTWSIVEPTTPGATTLGPFTLDSSPLGAVPIGTLNIALPRPLRMTRPSPDSGPVGGGTAVTLRGTGFLGVVSLVDDGAFNGGYVIVDDSTITFVTDPAISGPGTWLIVLTDSNGQTASFPFKITT